MHAVCAEDWYFPTSLVETAFLIYRKRSDEKRPQQPVEVLISEEGFEDAALRALRLSSEADLSIEGVERFRQSAQAFTRESWRPLRRQAYAKKVRLSSLELPCVGDLFRIKQGARLGHAVFILRESQYQELSNREKKFFRPAAGGGSIRRGQLLPTEYVFYPYASDGSTVIATEEELRSRLPAYYSKYLEPVKHALAARKGFESTWWKLYRERSWQWVPSPKLVSTYFGESGSFAFDDRGDSVSVNGHAWVWAKGSVQAFGDTNVPFEQTPALWAYLAILNSKVFEDIMSLFSVRLQGGQLRLESRFLSQVPLPDLTEELQTPMRAVPELIKLGKAVHAGELASVGPDIDRLVSLLYGLA